MWVSKLEIENIKSFKGEHSIELSKKINLLVGPNNSGKSTIINTIHCLQEGGIWQGTTIGARSFKNKVFFENPNINLYRATSYQTNKIPLDKILLIDLRLRKIFSKEGLQMDFSPIINIEPQNFIYPFLSKRKVVAYQEIVNSNVVQVVTGNFTHLFAKVDRLSNLLHPKHKKYMEACESIIGFPITALESEGGKEAAIFIGTGDKISLKEMGEGVANILALIVDLCVSENKLFLIEEPENDLHPKALKALCNLIIQCSENNQFIISTHSNIVTKYLGAEPETKIFHITTTLDSEIQNLRVSFINEVPDTREARMGVLEDLGYEFNDYNHWAAWLFFEESSAEELVRDYFIKWYAPELVSSLRTYSARSVSEIDLKFKDFNNLFVFIHLESIYKNKAWVIVDAGENEREIIGKMKETYKNHGWKEDRFKQLSEHDFEKYYPERFQEQVKHVLSLKGTDKRQAKADLLNEVKDWIKENDATAKSEFEKSAKEVIELLKEIEAEIK